MTPERERAVEAALCRALCAEVRLEVRRGRSYVRTPFAFPDGDSYVLAIEDLPMGGVRLTDGGHTFMHLSYDVNVDVLFDGTRGRLLDSVLSSSGVTLDSGRLSVEGSFDELGLMVVRLGQAITRVYDLTFLSKTRAESTFYDDLKAAIIHLMPVDRIETPYLVPALGADAENYPVDYYLHGGRLPVYLFGVPNRDKARLSTIVLHALIRSKHEFESVVVFENQQSIPRPDLARLTNVAGDMVASLSAADDLARKVLRRVAA